ncbi:hypothetical protein [Blastococcus sp. SYSU D00813]
MRLLNRLAVITGGTLVAVALAAPATAAPPRSGDCPTPFRAATQSQLAQVLALLDPTVPLEAHEASAAGAFARLNKNGDAVLCYIPIGRRGFVNVIDNVVPR